MAHDLVIIGGGTAGLGAARAARAVGAAPALVSDGPLGGDCTFTGCVPSKTLIAESRRGSSFTDALDTVAETVDRIAATETAAVLRSEGIEVIHGHAQLTGPNELNVDGRPIAADRIIIATGARARRPSIPGLETVGYLTNENLFEPRAQPRRFGVIGAGPIGSEMAMALAGFGIEVIVFEIADRVLPNEEPQASAVLEAALTGAGVRVLTSAVVERVDEVAGGIAVGVAGESVVVDELLVAVGRTPNVEGLGLEEIGVDVDAGGHPVVNAKMRTSVRSISAAGDVTGLLPFTHAADEQGRLAAGHALGKGARWKYDRSFTPWVTFTDPEIARFGMLEAEAAALNARVAYLPLDRVDRAITDSRTDGFVKLIAGPRAVTRNAFGGRLLGATVVAPRAGEMIHAPVVLARSGGFVGRLAQATAAYPTWSTAIQQAASQFFREVSGLEARPAQA